MRIGIIGAGNVGLGLTKHLIPQGHTVMLSFNRAEKELRSKADAVGALSGTVREATEYGDLVVLATPWSATADALKLTGEPAKGKVLWDCTNVLKPDFSGLLIGTDNSGGEEVARLAPWATVVKAIPPFAELLHSPTTLIAGKLPTVWVCSDDDEARKLVSGLVSQIGANPVDAGPLRLARYVEPASMLLVHLAYMGGRGARIGVSFNQDQTGKQG